MHVHARVVKPDSGSVGCQWIVEKDRKRLAAISATAGPVVPGFGLIMKGARSIQVFRRL